MSCDLVVLLSLAELTGIECDAVKEWSNIVELAKRSNVWIYSFCVYTCIVPRLVKYCLPAMHERTCATMNIERKTYIFQVIFNGIDVGEYFDYAVTSLCVSVGVAYVAASSYGHSAVVDCYPSPFLPRDGPCWACNNSPNDRDILAQLVPPHITLLSSLSFIPKVMLRYTSVLFSSYSSVTLYVCTSPLQDSHMPATQDVGSSVLVASLAATLATGAWINGLHGYQLPHWTTCDFTTLSMTSFRVDRSPSCLICNQAPRSLIVVNCV